MGRGGSESKVMWGIEALKQDYRVAIITTRSVNLASLNEFYGTSVSPEDVDIRIAPLAKVIPDSVVAAAARGAIHTRFCQQVAHEYDVLISAYNLLDWGRPALHFVADFTWHPTLRTTFDPVSAEWSKMIHRDNLLRRCYLGACQLFSRRSGRDLLTGDDWIAANSQWTARTLNELGARPQTVIYPVVAWTFPEVAWAEKENGFVSIGRIAPEKRIEVMIDILRLVRQRGHDIHFHVAGAVGNDPYGQLVRRRCQQEAGWITLEGSCVGHEKEQLLTRHRYAIHSRPYEAFGISVAEYAKAGCIPFIPNSGGQTEIVNQPDLTYDDIDEAVDKIDRVLRDEDRQRELREHVALQGKQFGVEIFTRAYRDIVEQFQAQQ